MKNLEIKAKVKNHKLIIDTIKRIGAKYVKKVNQKDTYFKIPTGRLKLREFNSVKSELIYYNRIEDANQRWSDYHLFHISQPVNFRNFLARCLPIKIVVDKSRTLYMYKEARIHIDVVKHLGNYIEIESQALNGEKEAKSTMKELLDKINLPKNSFVKKSYSDLLLKLNKK